jgi:hypothetical protein
MQQGIEPIDLADLMSWWDRCEKFAHDFWIISLYARYRMLRELSSQDRAQVQELVDLLDEARGLLAVHTKPLAELYDTQGWYIRVGIWATAALAVYDADKDALKNCTWLAFGNQTHLEFKMPNGQKISVEIWPVLSKALVENHLKGWKDWRNVKGDPQAYIARVARNIAWEQAQAEAAEANTIPLDEIAGTVAESSEAGITAERRFTERSLAALIDAARADPDLASYVPLRVAGLKHKAARARLGWTKSHAYNVQVRYLRLRKKLRECGTGAEYVERGVISDASRNTFYEVLEDGKLGSAPPRHGKYRSGGGRGIWQHRNRAVPPK